MYKKVKTKLLRAWDLSKLQTLYNTICIESCNSLIHPYLHYSILNWGRAPLIKLQNKATKLIRPIKQASVEEPFQHLNILWLSTLYTLSVGKFMHSKYNKLLSYHFHDYFIPISAINYHITRLSTSNNLFLPRVNLFSGKFSLHLLAQKCGLQYQVILSLQGFLPLNESWEAHPRRKRYEVMNFSNISHIQNHILWVLEFCNSVCFLHIYFLPFFFPVHIPFFTQWK